ncbi:WD repeat-containing protein on Y chromosome-like isoform X4 [Ruditapes philippinarum]|uniref:WD repeat-containing protein on Y chromosome-like isoform X4 n=1 Tax=Ruditapes philippinarum TaxID=129788 RepID=UPI00295C0063|nr:WD repeat-containing protein on Y chromosome-like isoform X4 [Ruditapes philippinarum]
MTSSVNGFDGGYSVLPPILSTSNSQENLDINSNSVDKNSNNVDKNSNNSDKNNTSDINSNKTGKGTDDGISLPEAPFSSILQSRRPTYSDENSFDKDENVRLEEEIKLHHLEQLMNRFSKHKPDDILIQAGTGFFPAKTQARIPGRMNLKEFKQTVSEVLATDEYDDYLEKLFMKLDSSVSGYVDWNEFCTYLLLLYRENDYMRTKREIPFLVEPKIRHIVQNRQEQTTKIVAVDGPTRYVTVSREGAISVWYPSMQYDKYYVISDNEEDTSQKRRFKMWVTDAIFMPNCHKIAIASTSRDIRFFDTSTAQYFEEYHLFALPDVPYCFDYWYDKRNPNSESLLIFGNDTGAINLMYFSKPVTQLFDIPFKSDGGAHKIFMQNLDQHSRYIRHTVIPDVHPELIRQVQYLPDNNMIISSCANPSKSMIISDIKCLKKSYVFKIDKGVECFDFSKKLNILVTGSLDHCIRLWNPYVTSKPMAVLEGHGTGVIGVKIHEGLLQVFSYSKDAVVKVWDIKEHAILQTVVLKFPSSIHGRMPEHGQFPIHLQPSPQSSLLVTCNDYIGLLKLGRTSIPRSETVNTHDTQLCCAIYNPVFKQVATGCDSSVIALWDIETGNKSVVFSNAHGEEEITCMTFDTTYRRLFSGARNGTIKVWNFQNGHNLHKLEAVAEAEVTGIMPLVDKKVILSVGWSRQITIYDDSDPDSMYLQAQKNWKGGQLHKDDILTIDFCPPNLLCTASFDGEIIVWDVETEKIFVRLRKGQVSNLERLEYERAKKIENMASQAADGSRPRSMNSRPNSRHQKSHRVERGQTAPVDKVLFLKGRATGRNLEVSTLITSEGGYIRFWCLYGARNEMGFFYAPDFPDESVLAMCTNNNNSLLVTGDTQGNVKVWDIMTHCIKFQDRGRIKAKPQLEAAWRAHDAAIVSVEFAKHDTGDYVITASTDKTARIWTLREGHYIGTLGQKKSWNLKDQSTWAHPKTPWTMNDVSSKKDTGLLSFLQTQDFNLEDSSTASDAKSQVTENDLDLPEEAVESKKEASPVKSRSPEQESTNQNGENTDEVETKNHHKQPRELRPVDKSKKYKDELGPLRVKFRSQTFAYNALRPERSKTFLGIRVEKELQRKQADRKGRRDNFGGIKMKKTQQYGKLCSPFQALSVPSVMDIKIPENMPLSSRMINKGYTSLNLTEDKLMNMDFSYGGRETPPGEQGEAVTRKNVGGSRVSMRDDKSRNSVRSTPKIYAPVFKKHHTVA